MKSFSEHIKKKQKEYYGAIGDDMEINPISISDTNIIKELCEILKKTGYSEAIEVMKDYKKLPDFEIEQRLIEINVLSNNHHNELDDLVDDEEHKQKTIFFNDIRGSRYKIADIFMYFKYIQDEYPCIYLNETPPQAAKLPVVSDVVLKYKNETDRDADILILDNLF